MNHFPIFCEYLKKAKCISFTDIKKKKAEKVHLPPFSGDDIMVRSCIILLQRQRNLVLQLLVYAFNVRQIFTHSYESHTRQLQQVF